MSYNESLNSNSNYPLMSQSEWDNAPWNQENLPEKQFNIVISYTLSKEVSVASTNYDPYGCSGEELLDTPIEDYNNQHYTIQELLGILKDIATKKLADKENINKWKQIIQDCEDWVVDEEVAEQI